MPSPPESAPGHKAQPNTGHGHESSGAETASNGYAYDTIPPPSPSPPPPPPNKPVVAPAPQRALAPDLLRGLLMLFMAFDHNTVGLNAWRHSTGPPDGERDSAPVDSWTWWFGYLVRTLSHLCAPGFTFLLGMGIVYFGRSRTKLGWSAARMARHFAVRGAVLTLVSVVLGLVLTAGRFWFMNVVLVALGVDYVLAGLLWLAIAATEPALAALLDRYILTDDDDDDDDEGGREREPLLEHAGHHTPSATTKPSAKATAVSWHAHNILLLVLSLVTIWWNIWLSPTHGTCTTTESSPPPSPSSTANDFWRFWFFEVISTHVVSPFPPLAWLSFAILGLLYARIATSRPHPASVTTQICANLSAALLFLALFVLTRVLRFGNLSEHCLRAPEHLSHPPPPNPYLASPASFFYIVKYPPDVAFYSFTLAGTFLLLAAFSAVPPRLATRYLGLLLAFGTSALFFYVVHMVVLMGMCVLLIRLVGRDTGLPPPPDGRPATGVDSVWVWALNWAFVMSVMYPLCRWYSGFKGRRGADSVWRFF